MIATTTKPQASHMTPLIFDGPISHQMADRLKVSRREYRSRYGSDTSLREDDVAALARFARILEAKGTTSHKVRKDACEAAHRLMFWGGVSLAYTGWLTRQELLIVLRNA